jgi:hypothetical protein
MGGFPSGQRGQTVNLLAMPSKVRILLRPLNIIKKDFFGSPFSYAEKEIRGKKPKRFESFSAHYLRGLLRKSFFFGSKDGKIKILQG